MHLPLDQGESAADAMVSSGEVGEPVQVIDLAGGRDLLRARAAKAAPGDGETVPALVIQGTFSRFSLSVIGRRPLLNAHSGRGLRTWWLRHRCASGDKKNCDTGENGVDKGDSHDFWDIW